MVLAAAPAEVPALIAVTLLLASGDQFWNAVEICPWRDDSRAVLSLPRDTGKDLVRFAFSCPSKTVPWWCHGLSLCSIWSRNMSVSQLLRLK